MTEPPSEIGRIARIALWHWRTVLGWTALGIGLVIAILAFVPPLYSATALLLVAPQTLQGVDPVASRMANEAMRIDSEVELLRSNGVLAAAAQALALDQDREFAGSTAEETVVNLSETLAIARRGTSAIIAIEARSRSAAKAARIANTIAVVGAAQQRARKMAELSDQATAFRHGAATVAGSMDGAAARDLQNRATRLLNAGALQVTDLRFVSAALIPPKPRLPNWPVSIALAGVAAFGVGVFRALSTEARLGGFRDPREVEARFGFPVFAIDIHMGPPGAVLDGSDGIGVGTPMEQDAGVCRLAEAARHLAKIGDKTDGNGRAKAPLLLVGAARSDEAALAARVTLDLARVLTEPDRRILLVEHDVARPHLVRLLGLRLRTGLQDLLAVADTSSPAPPVIMADKKPGLDLILARDGVAGVDAALPRFDRLRPLLAAARGSYDLVIALGSPTATLLEPIARDASLILLVIGSHRVPGRLVATAIDGLRAAAGGHPALAALLARTPDRRRLTHPRRALDVGHRVA